MKVQNDYINRICEKYNKKQVKSFMAKSAEKNFLGPLGINLKYIPSHDLGNSKKRLSKKEEFQIFTALHFLKYKIKKARKAKERYIEIYIILRNRVISGNWNLLLKCVNKHLKYFPSADYALLMGKGNLVLIYTADAFDPWKGFRFSTYACCSIFKNFSEQPKKRSITLIPIDDQVRNTATALASNSDVELWTERLGIILKNSHLTSRELEIIAYRFPSFSNSENEKLTLGKVSMLMGITTERVRQIQVKVLKKLKKQMLEDEILKW